MKIAGFICGVLLGISAIIWYMTPDRSEQPLATFDQEANIPSENPDLTTGSEYTEDPMEILPEVPIEPPTGLETLPVAVATEPPQFQKPEQNMTAAPSANPNPSWQIIWKPFRNESSALGFAERLRSVTGLNIEVQQKTPIKYVVAFPYSDEDQRLKNIEHIESQTGLVLVLGDR